MAFSASIGPIAPQIMAYDRLSEHDLGSLRLFITMSAAERLEAHLGVPCSNLFGITEGLLLGSPATASAQARHHTQGWSGCPDKRSAREERSGISSGQSGPRRYGPGRARPGRGRSSGATGSVADQRPGWRHQGM